MSKSKILFRIFYCLVFFLFIGLLIYENTYVLNKSKNSFSIEKYLREPEKFGNKKMERIIKIENISNNHFYFQWGEFNIKVLGSGIEKPVLGETVVYLNFRKDGIIEMIDYHNYNYNYVLYTISVFALILFLIFFFMEWKLTKRGFEDA